MRQNEEQSDRADKNKQKNKANKHDKKRQRKPSPSESDPPVRLGERLQQWARDYNWYQAGQFQNALVIKRAFAKPIGKAAEGFLSQGHVALALQIKTDFNLLIDIVKRFDKRFHQKFGEEEEWIACEYLREQIHTTLDGLAALLDNRDLKNDCSGTPPATAATPFNPDHWMTFGQAAQILAVSKATISNWTTKGRIRDNSEKGQRRRVLKADVLLVKHEAELADLVRDAIEIRGDAQRIERRH